MADVDVDSWDGDVEMVKGPGTAGIGVEMVGGQLPDAGGYGVNA